MSPVVILIRPQMGENIGAVARAMSNFGLSELRIVAPRDGWPNRKALETSAGGEGIIQSAKTYPDFRAAMSDINIAYATTARPRDMNKRVLSPSEAMVEIAEKSLPPLRGKVRMGGNDTVIPPTPALPHEGGGSVEKIALVFGPERTGIENEEIILCDTIITIPTSTESPSLNLAQAMVVVGYEWVKYSVGVGVSENEQKPAPKEDMFGLFDQLEGYLDKSEYWRTENKKPVMWQNLKNMLLRGAWSEQEVRTFRGMLRSLWERSK